jgi:hypothetical protein
MCQAAPLAADEGSCPEEDRFRRAATEYGFTSPASSAEHLLLWPRGRGDPYQPIPGLAG